MTPAELSLATGARIDRATEFLPIIERAAVDFEVTTPDRMAAFLAQVGHESGGLHWLAELWGPTTAQSRYEGREDLGNDVDHWRKALKAGALRPADAATAARPFSWQ